MGRDFNDLYKDTPADELRKLMDAKLCKIKGNGDVAKNIVHIANDEEKVSGSNDNNATWDWTSSVALKDINLPPLVPWLEPIAFAGSGSIVHGATGAGKTMWGLGLSLALVKGTSYGPYTIAANVSPLRVLYLDYELGRRLMKDRLDPFVHPRLHIICRDCPQLGDEGLLPIDTDEGKEQVGRFVEAIKPDVIFIDNLYYAVAGDFFSGGDKNSAVPKLKFLKKLGPAYFIFNHLGHNQSHGYGDKRISWGMDSELLMEAGDDNRTGHLTARITEKKMRVRRGALLKPYTMSFDGNQWLWESSEQLQSRRLSERAAWLLNEVDRMLNAGKGQSLDSSRTAALYVDEVRETFKDKYYPRNQDSKNAAAGCSKIFKELDGRLSWDERYLWRTIR